jgi:hypothetical protein
VVGRRGDPQALSGAVHSGAVNATINLLVLATLLLTGLVQAGTIGKKTGYAAAGATAAIALALAIVRYLGTRK